MCGKTVTTPKHQNQSQTPAPGAPMRMRTLYYSQNGYLRVAAVNHEDEQGALMHVNQNQAHLLSSIIRNRAHDAEALRSTLPAIEVDEWGWWCFMHNAPTNCEQIIYPDGWKAMEAPKQNTAAEIASEASEAEATSVEFKADMDAGG